MQIGLQTEELLQSENMPMFFNPQKYLLRCMLPCPSKKPKGKSQFSPKKVICESASEVTMTHMLNTLITPIPEPAKGMGRLSLDAQEDLLAT